MNSVYHNGERYVQNLTGEQHIAERHARMVSGSLSPLGIHFISSQQVAVISSADKDDRVWASLLLGDDFIHANATTIDFDRAKIKSTSKDILYENIKTNKAVGSLYIELATRRRFRANGLVNLNKDSIELSIREAYGNCPKYIQSRSVDIFELETKPKVTHGNKLTSQEIDCIRNADTVFIASKSLAGRFDASHRGGPQGFIEMENSSTLKIPDYLGNSMYNTLGNLAENPQVGLLFIDFEKGDTLQLTGAASLLFDQTSETDLKKTTGTGRFWRVEVTDWIKIENHHNAKWTYIDASPLNPVP